MGKHHKHSISTDNNNNKSINRTPKSSNSDDISRILIAVVNNNRTVIKRKWPFESLSTIDTEVKLLRENKEELLVSEWMQNYYQVLVNQRYSVKDFMKGRKCAALLASNEPSLSVSERETAQLFNEKKDELLNTLAENDRTIRRSRRKDIFIDTMNRHYCCTSENFRINVVFT